MNHNSPRVRLFSRRLARHTLIAVRGELDIVTTAALRDRMYAALNDTTMPMIIDLSGVSFCDASGLALLIGVQRRARVHGVSISLAAPRPNVSKLLRITGLDRAFTVHPTLAAAQLDHRHIDHPVAA